MNKIMNTIRTPLRSIVAAALTATALSAAEEWKQFPIWGGGNLQSVEISASSPNVWYTYADVDGPYRSDDAGKNWVPLHGNFNAMQRRRGLAQIRGLSVDPRNPDSFVTVSGSTWWRVGGICVSRDGGKTFRQTQEARFYGNGLRRRTGFVLARNPDRPDELIAASDSTGVFRSIDNGESWQPAGLDGCYFSSVLYDRTVPGRVYASAPRWGSSVYEKGAIFGKEKSRRSGLFRSDDGGRTWEQLQDDGPMDMVQLKTGELLGTFEERFIRLSHDGGKTWQEYGEGLPAGEINHRLSSSRWTLAAAGPDFFVVGNSRGNLYRRKHETAKWEKIPRRSVTLGQPEQESHLDPKWAFGASAQTLVIDPRDSRHWLLTDWFSIWESFDGGESWRSAIRGISPLVSYFVAADPHAPDRLFYGLADMGLLRSDDGGKSWKKQPFIGINSIAFSRKTPGLAMICGGKNEIRIRRLRSGSSSWETPRNLGLPALKPGNMAAYTIAADPREDKFYLCVSGPVAPGKGGVYVSSDAGDHWKWMGKGFKPGFSFDRTEFQNGGTSQIQLSPDGSAVAFSSASKQLYRLDREKQSWQFVRNLPSGTQPDEGVPWRSVVAADPFTPGRFLCAGNGILLESRDGGKSFDNNWLVTGTIHSIAFDPETPGLLAILLADRILLSRDGGKHFAVLSIDGVPITTGTRIVLDRKRLFAATWGSGVFYRSVE